MSEDCCGRRLDGAVLTDDDVLEATRDAGSLTMLRGPADRLRHSDWAQHLVDLARVRGVNLSVRDEGRIVVVLDVDWPGWAPPVGEDRQRSIEASKAGHPSRARGPSSVRSPEDA